MTFYVICDYSGQYKGVCTTQDEAEREAKDVHGCVYGYRMEEDGLWCVFDANFFYDD